ncbi:hypothetical protein BAE44_0001123, partial [Dichanthelium oligosanthes]
LRKGNLWAANWDDVANAVTARCGRFPTATPKSGVQCRHKIEKLRKRYRAERSRSAGRSKGPKWQFFPLLHDLAGGGVPAPAQTPSSRSRPRGRGGGGEGGAEAARGRSRGGGGEGGARAGGAGAARGKRATRRDAMELMGGRRRVMSKRVRHGGPGLSEGE